jgi:hypothetical protein
MVASTRQAIVPGGSAGLAVPLILFQPATVASEAWLSWLSHFPANESFNLAKKPLLFF